jgi:hypothetical protein
MRITKKNGFYKVEYQNLVFCGEILETTLELMRQTLILKGVVAK